MSLEPGRLEGKTLVQLNLETHSTDALDVVGPSPSPCSTTPRRPPAVRLDIDMAVASLCVCRGNKQQILACDFCIAAPWKMHYSDMPNDLNSRHHSAYAGCTFVCRQWIATRPSARGVCGLFPGPSLATSSRSRDVHKDDPRQTGIFVSTAHDRLWLESKTNAARPCRSLAFGRRSSRLCAWASPLLPWALLSRRPSRADLLPCAVRGRQLVPSV